MATVEEALGEVERACPSCHGHGRMYSAVPGSTLSEPCAHRIHAAAARLVEACFSEAHAKRCECGEDTELYGKVYQARVDPRCAAIRERAKR